MSRRYGMAVGILAAALAVVVLVVLASRQAFAQQGRGVGGRGGNTTASSRLIDNARVTVQRLTTAPNTPAEPHAHPDQDFVTIQITPGDLEVTVGTETSKGAVGKAWWLPRGVSHAVSNKGREPVDVIAITVK